MSTKEKDYLKLNPYLEITSGIHAVLTFSEGVIKVTGTKGSGKSAICNLLLDELKQDELEAVLFEEVLESSQEFEDIIQEKLALKKVSDFVSDLTNHLVSKPAHQQKLILIIDDSDKASDEVFETISQLADIEHDLTPLVSIVLCGEEELNQKIHAPDKKSILDKVILSLQVQPMDKEELETYCQAYISKVGLENHHLSSDAYSKIFEESRGIPEKIPELIYQVIDEEANETKVDEADSIEKRQAPKLVELADDPEPELSGLSVEEREQALLNYKEQVPWRWQSNGVAIAVVVLFAVVAYGWFRPKAVPTQVLPNREFIDVSLIEAPAEVFEAETVVEIEESLVESIVEEEPEVIANVSLDAELLEPESDVEVSNEQEFGETLVEDGLTQEIVEVDGLIAGSIEYINEFEAAGESSLVGESDRLQDSGEELVTNEAESVQEPIEEASEVQQQIANAISVEENERGVQTTSASNTRAPAPTNSQVSVDQNLSKPQKLISQWAQAWEDQNVEEYFDSYQERFKSSYHDSQNMWRGDRQLKISRPQYIEIDVDGLELIESNTAGLTIRFWLNYVSSYYKDRTLKEVLLTENSLGEFLIMQEKNLEVEILPYYP